VRQSFVRKLGKEMRETFPDFQKNPYYVERVGAEEKKLVRMQLTSTAGFILYYKLLWGYRNFRKARRA
jgi:ribosomal protein S17E